MGHWEDLHYEIHDSLDKLGLRKQFDAQLKKMQHQEKHEYKDARERWTYAYDKVVSLHKKNQSIK